MPKSSQSNNCCLSCAYRVTYKCPQCSIHAYPVQRTTYAFREKTQSSIRACCNNLFLSYTMTNCVLKKDEHFALCVKFAYFDVIQGQVLCDIVRLIRGRKYCWFFLSQTSCYEDKLLTENGEYSVLCVNLLIVDVIVRIDVMTLTDQSCEQLSMYQNTEHSSGFMLILGP